MSEGRICLFYFLLFVFLHSCQGRIPLKLSERKRCGGCSTKSSVFLFGEIS